MQRFSNVLAQRTRTPAKEKELTELTTRSRAKPGFNKTLRHKSLLLVRCMPFGGRCSKTGGFGAGSAGNPPEKHKDKARLKGMCVEALPSTMPPVDIENSERCVNLSCRFATNGARYHGCDQRPSASAIAPAVLTEGCTKCQAAVARTSEPTTDMVGKGCTPTTWLTDWCKQTAAKGSTAGGLSHGTEGGLSHGKGNTIFCLRGNGWADWATGK